MMLDIYYWFFEKDKNDVGANNLKNKKHKIKEIEG